MTEKHDLEGILIECTTCGKRVSLNQVNRKSPRMFNTRNPVCFPKDGLTDAQLEKVLSTPFRCASCFKESTKKPKP